MSVKETNIILTGATGVVGRHVLYELTQKYVKGELNGNIVVIVRSARVFDKSAAKRIKDLFTHEYAPDYIKKYDVNRLMKFITIVDCDISSSQLSYKLNVLDRDDYYVIHSASSTNLDPSDKCRDELLTVNYLQTLNFLEACSKIIKKFTFVSSAFSSGELEGLISDNFLNTNVDDCKFRNPYEELKAKTEREIVKRADQLGIDWQILRPAVVCGRLIDTPLYYTPKFNVFYCFGKLFKTIAKPNKKKSNIRIIANSKSSTNIVSTDYTAKAIVKAFETDIKELNIVNSQNIPVKFLISYLLKKVNFDDFKMVNSIETKLNSLEKIYYRTAGKHLTPYINGPESRFDTTALRNLMPEVKEPDIFKDFEGIYSFAVDNDFKEF